MASRGPRRVNEADSLEIDPITYGNGAGLRSTPLRGTGSLARRCVRWGTRSLARLRAVLARAFQLSHSDALAICLALTLAFQYARSLLVLHWYSNSHTHIPKTRARILTSKLIHPRAL